MLCKISVNLCIGVYVNCNIGVCSEYGGYVGVMLLMVEFVMWFGSVFVYMLVGVDVCMDCNSMMMNYMFDCNWNW